MKENEVLREKKPQATKRASGRTAKKSKELAPQKLKLLITIVNRNKAEFYLDLLHAFEINLQYSVAAEGTAGSEVLHLMGLEESEKAAIFSLVREDLAPAAMAVLEEKFATIKNGKGIAFTVPLTGVIGVSIYRFLCNNRKAMKEEVSQ